MRTGFGHAMVIRWRAASVLLLCLSHTGSGLLVSAPSPHTAILRSRVVLPCTFQLSTSTINPQFLAIIWNFRQKELVRLDNKETVVGEGVTFDVEKARRGDASLTIPSVNVSSQGTYTCTIIYSPNTRSSEIELYVHAQPEVHIRRNVVLRDKDNQLHCSIINFFPREITVRWQRNGKEFGAPKMTAAQMNADGTYRVNSSVVLPADQSHDQPTITCQVEHVSSPSPVQDSFRLRYGEAPKVRVSAAKSQDGNELLYVCEARGFSPEELSINWKVDGKQLDNSGGKNDQLYNKEIYYRLNITDGNLPDHISCDVQHETLAKPTTKLMKVEQFNECRRHCHTGLTVFFGILSLLAVGTAILLGHLIRKKKYFRVSHIYKDQTWSDEEKVTLYCLAFRCPEDVQVVWTVVVEGREPITVSDSKKDTDEEKALLSQHRDYTATTVQPEEHGQRNATAILSFNPSAAEYRKMDITCSLTCGHRKKERTLQCTFNLKKPEAADNCLKMYLNESGDVVCSVVLEKFYPRDIQITWSCGTAQLQEMGTTEKSVTHNTDFTYNVLSECRISKQLFQHSSDVMRVRVTWKHKNTNDSQSREKDLTDFPRCPVMGDVSVTPLVHGREARLQCDIRGYFPDDLEVKWLRRDAGKQELYEVSSNDKYKVPAMESTSQDSGKTFSCTAALVISSVSAITDGGSEFICRVMHPSLQKPLEKRTGGLPVTGKPLIKKTLQDERYIILDVGGFYTEDLVVTWGRAKKQHDTYKEIEKKDITDNTTVESDGSYSLTSVCEAINMKALMNPNDLYVKATVRHGALKSPEEMVFLRSGGKFYLLENGKREALPQGDRKMLKDKKKSNSVKESNNPDRAMGDKDDTSITEQEK